jgi:hypothetical protein
MSIVKQREVTRNNKPVETEGNVRDLRRRGGIVHLPEDGGEQASTLVGAVSVASTCEIDRLIDDLKNLRDKLENDGNRIQTDIIEYATLSQSAMQLTKIISDSMARVEEISVASSNDEPDLTGGAAAEED